MQARGKTAFAFLAAFGCLAPLFLFGAGSFKAYLVFLVATAGLAVGVVLFFRRQLRTEAAPGWVVLIAGSVLLLLLLIEGAFVLAETYYRFVYDHTDAMGLSLVLQA